MIRDVVEARYLGGYKVDITFDDGCKGIVDFKKYIDKGGVFKKLEDINVFKSFEINNELGVITWNGEIDIAPETLYSDATKSSLPSWMD